MSFTSSESINKQFTVEELGLNGVFDEEFFYNFSTILTRELSLLDKKVRLLKGQIRLEDNNLSDETFFLIGCSIEGMFDFIEDMDFLGESSGEIESKQIRKLSIAKVIQESIEKIEKTNLESSRIEIKTSGLDEIFCNEFLLSSIVVNLVSNSLKFSRDKVFLGIESLFNELIIIVRDSGIGIPEDDFNDIFMPFYKASNAKRISGTGLGLAIVGKLLRYNNGQVSIKSEVMKGTEVKISIPLKATFNPEVSSEIDSLP